VKTISQSVYYINHTTCFGLLDHHQVCMNKSNKYITFMLNYMINFIFKANLKGKAIPVTSCEGP
jgi:hypothetical protein